jgi:hypothetical protein
LSYWSFLFQKKVFWSNVTAEHKTIVFCFDSQKNRSREQSEEFRDQFFQIREKRVKSDTDR